MRVSPLILALAFSVPFAGQASAQVWLNADTSKKVNQSSFRALEDWPAPSDLRRASGAPGARYWQQQVDYVIKVSLDTTTHRVTGSEVVTYHNNSPDKLPTSGSSSTRTSRSPTRAPTPCRPPFPRAWIRGSAASC